MITRLSQKILWI